MSLKDNSVASGVNAASIAKTFAVTEREELIITVHSQSWKRKEHGLRLS